MILRDIFVDLDRSQHPSEIAYAFKLRSRCLCHFVGRHVWEKRIRVPNFNRIVITLSRKAVPEFFVNSSHVACIRIPADDATSQQLAGNALQEFYIDCLSRGVDRFLGDFPEALVAIREGIELFRAGGYRNAWVQKARRLQTLGLSASLACSMTIERFSLRLAILRAKTPIYDQEIFTSDPDEIVFAHRFKDVVASDRKVVVVDRFSHAVLTLSLEDVEANKPTSIDEFAHFPRIAVRTGSA